MTKLIVGFCNFANWPTKSFFLRKFLMYYDNGVRACPSNRINPLLTCVKLFQNTFVTNTGQ
jgi:hypothetical protein